jgi:hypothetical protein
MIHENASAIAWEHAHSIERAPNLPEPLDEPDVALRTSAPGFHKLPMRSSEDNSCVALTATRCALATSVACRFDTS